MRKYNRFYLLIILMITVVSCETLELKVEDSPNNLSPQQADVDFFLNAIQQGLAAFHSGIEGSGFQSMSELGMEPVRMLHGFGPSYREYQTPGSYNEVWDNAYSFTLADIRTMIPLAEEGGLFTHLAIGQVIEAYIMMSLVDYFGDVPYSEAINGTDGIFNPKLDSGAAIYTAVDQLLLDAINNFQKEETALPTNDFYYGGDEAKWLALAKTLRLKVYLQTRLAEEEGFNASRSTSEINNLIADGGLITTIAQDFQFLWGTNISAPDSRHPFYEKNYGGAGPNAGFYMANYYLDLLANHYSQVDPRIRYYFYRQVSDFSGANVVTNSCSTQARPSWYDTDDIFCQVPSSNDYNGLWGWDHLRADGIPPDQQFRTLFGVYPVGGAFDDGSFRNVSGSAAVSEGLQGAGISPIMISSYTNFMLAEAALTLGTTGDARTYLEEGVRMSINKAIMFGSSLAPEDFVPTQAEIDTHVGEILAEYDGGDEDLKLKIIVEQYFIALWGNGIEAYNTYRRTGQPSDVQPAVDLSDPGIFIKSHFYPQNAADNNSSITQKSEVTEPVFWDTNAADILN